MAPDAFGYVPDGKVTDKIYRNIVSVPFGTEFLFVTNMAQVKHLDLTPTRFKEVILMENRISVVSIIIEDTEMSSKVNELLHNYSQYIVGRMGIPYKDRGVSIISIVMDAPADETSSLSGKLGMLKGVSAKTLVSKYQVEKEG